MLEVLDLTRLGTLLVGEHSSDYFTGHVFALFLQLLNIAHFDLSIVVYLDLRQVFREVPNWIDVFLVEILKQVRVVNVQLKLHDELLLCLLRRLLLEPDLK